MERCDPGREREREERGTPTAAAIGLPALRGKIASFGPFRLHVTERLLEKNDVPLKIGSREARDHW